MSAVQAFVETHQCVHTRFPVERDICLQLCSVIMKNHGGCSTSHCTSEWRLCRICVTLNEKERSHAQIDAVSGLCEKHGGVIVIPEPAEINLIELGTEVLEIPTHLIARMPDQPRRHFDPDDLASLRDSIKERGQIHPGLVRRTPNAALPFELRDGERRWIACDMAGRMFRATEQKSAELGRNDALLTSAAANFNRADHTPWEEIDLVRRLLNPCPDTGKKYTPTQVAVSLGKDQNWVSQRKIVGERLTPESMVYISEHVKVPFSIIKQIADMRPDEQLTAFEDYREGKVKMNVLQSRAGANRQAQGLSRHRKPSDIWSGATLILRTVEDRIGRMCETFSPQMLNTTLKSIAREQGEDAAKKLDELADRLKVAARNIRAQK